MRGAIALATLAKEEGLRGIVVPAENASEAAVVEEIEVIGVRTLTEVVGLLHGQIEPRREPVPDVAGLIETAQTEVDFVDVRGQEAVKRAIVIAAAGGHNLLMLGPAGTGKTMMAKALPGVLPPLMPQEAKTATIPSRPVSRTIGALRPSIARKYCTLKDSTGIQFSTLSTNWNWAAPAPRSYLANTMIDRTSSASETIPANHRTFRSPRTSRTITIAPASGRNTTMVNQPLNKFLLPLKTAFRIHDSPF